MDPPQDFKSLQEDVQKALISTIKAINRVSSHDLGFQRVANPDVDGELQKNSGRILKLASKLLKASASVGRVHAPKLDEPEDVDLNWKGIVDVLDLGFEKVDTALDEFAGLVKRKDPPAKKAEFVSAIAWEFLDRYRRGCGVMLTVVSALQDPLAKRPKVPSDLDRSHRYADVEKPQLKFEVPVNNFPAGPWKPVLTRKPHAGLPLEKSLALGLGSSAEEDRTRGYDYVTFLSLILLPDVRLYIQSRQACQPTLRSWRRSPRCSSSLPINAQYQISCRGVGKHRHAALGGEVIDATVAPTKSLISVNREITSFEENLGS